MTTPGVSTVRSRPAYDFEIPARRTRLRRALVLALAVVVVVTAALALTPARDRWLAEAGAILSAFFGGSDRTAAANESELARVTRNALRAQFKADPGRERRNVEALLARAALALNKGNVVTPAGENAVTLYQKVLAFEPDNAIARDALAQLIPRVLAAARGALARDDVAQTEVLVATAQQLGAPSSAVAVLRNDVAKRRGQVDSESARRAQIDQLIARAEAARGAGALTEPAGANALEYYRAALGLDPDNAAAEHGVRRLADDLVLQFNQALAQGDTAAARALLARAEIVSPTAAAVVDARRRFDSDGREPRR
jgi:hypothetical protein